MKNNKNKYLACISGALLTVTLLPAGAAELHFNFNSPAFSGIGYSSHVLTIQQLENQATEKNKAAADALEARARADAANTPTARFVANLESRIYSQLAKQLTDSMFGEGATCTSTGVVCGSLPDVGGNKIEWSLGAGSDAGMIIINIQNLANAAQITTMKVPAGTFHF